MPENPDPWALAEELRELLRPFAHHSLAGDSALDERTRQIEVRVCDLVRAWFAVEGKDWR